MRPDAFASENYKRIRRRVNDFADRLHSNLKPKKKRAYKKRSENPSTDKRGMDTLSCNEPTSTNYHSAEETWKKKLGTPKPDNRFGQ